MLNTLPTIMNEKVNVQDLIDILAARHGMSKKNAEGFAKEFFQLIEESLEKDKYVKIKGLGSFKLIDVESRESVNVNTGERIEIQGHTKISFTPEPALKDAINKPFSHFETVVLGDGIELEGVSQENEEEEEDNDNDSKASEPEEKEQITEEVVCEEVVVTPETAAVVEPEEETVAVLEEQIAVIPEEKTVAVPEKVYIVGGNTTAVEDTKVMKAMDEEPQNAVEKEENDIEAPKEDINEEPAGPKAVTEAEKREQFITSLRDRAVLESELLVSEPKAVPDSSAMKYFVGIVMFVILLCGGAIIFIYYPDWLDKLTPESVGQVTDPQIDQSLKTDQNALMGDSIATKDTIQPVKADTVAEIPVVTAEPKETQKEDVLQQASKSKEKQKEANPAPFVPDSVDYTIVGTETTYTIKEGETLTRVALRFYGTKKMWPYLVKHNADIIKNPDNVPYGTTIKIPKLVKKQ